MTNATILRFGYPDSRLKEYDHWVVLLRPAQLTIGCMVLACKEDAQALGAISNDAGAELPLIAADLEAALARAFHPDKINYLALMMVDPHVHFHVIPRYERAVEANGTVHSDAAWPKPPDMQSALTLSAADEQWIHQRLLSAWDG